jgi:lantibiotic modifying enzyme
MRFPNGNNRLNRSSRNILHTETRSAAAIPALSSWSLSATNADAQNRLVSQRGFEQNPDFLESAKGVALWIENAAQRRDKRRVYSLPELGHKERATTVAAPNAIYSASAETVLFFIQLANATGQMKYLQTASLGADYLVATWRELVDKPGNGLFSDRCLNLSLYGGLAGVAFVLNETGKATGKEKYREAARTATDYIVRAAKTAGSGLAWSDAPGIAGDGGIVLYLLYAAREFGTALYCITAERAGDHILELATNERHGGFSWSGFPAFPGLPKDTYLPAFEDGTAGIVYVFARLYSETNKARFLFAANQGASHLQSVATVGSKAELISHPLSDLSDLHYAGFCHGPAGTARAFFELYKITREPDYQMWAERLAQKVRQSDVPGSLTPGYWNVVCQCCGSAAVIDLFVEMWAFTGRRNYLAAAQRAARTLVNHETNSDGKRTRTVQTWARVNPREASTATYSFVGASGVASALLHIHLAEQGKYGAILLPENRFANIRWA